MKNILYNTHFGILLFIVLFLIWAYFLGNNCPCDAPDTNCVRHEFYGVQLNHFILFIMIGICFPSYFYTFQIIGILWEFFEYLLDKNPQWVIKYIGGCLKRAPLNVQQKKWDYIVYRDIEKPLNPIDSMFGIKNSKIHGWHGSPAEIIPNMLGFGVGYFINKLLI